MTRVLFIRKSKRVAVADDELLNPYNTDIDLVTFKRFDPYAFFQQGIINVSPQMNGLLQSGMSGMAMQQQMQQSQQGMSSYTQGLQGLQNIATQSRHYSTPQTQTTQESLSLFGKFMGYFK